MSMHAHTVGMQADAARVKGVTTIGQSCICRLTYLFEYEVSVCGNLVTTAGVWSV